MERDVCKASDEFCASLRIFGIGLDFGGISRGLGVEASETHRVGDRVLLSKPHAEDMWRLDSPLPPTEPMQAHLKWLRQMLLAHYDYLRSLMPTCEVSSFCGVRIDGDRCSLRLSPEALRIFVELGVPMELSLIFLGSPDAGTEPSEPEPTGTRTGQRESEAEIYLTESEVSLQILGTRLDFSKISSGLGLEPSQAHRHADLDPSGKPYESDTWHLTAPLPRTDPLDAHLKWLGAVLIPRGNFIRSLHGKADLLIRCNFGTESDTGGVELSPEALKAFVELEVPMEFNAWLI